MEITSINNPKIKYWEKLKTKKYRELNEKFLVEDYHLVNEAIKCGMATEIITIDNDLQYNIPTYHVNEKIMNLLSEQKTGCHIIAVCSVLPKKDITRNIIILDRLQDPGNMGTIIRSAVAFNFNTIVVSDDSVDVYNPKVIRASEGMIFHVNILRCHIGDFLKDLSSDYLKVTTDVNNGKNIKDLQSEKWALVIGNEGSGVSSEIMNLCDEKVHINMSSVCESLNAGVSASILMYEVNNG